MSLRHHWSRYATGGSVVGMTSEPANPTAPTQPATPYALLKAAPDPDRTAPDRRTTPDRIFEMCFTSTPRGARLARRLAAVRLDAWGVPYGTAPHDAIVLILGELTANAVQHGHVPGRDFHLRLHAAPDGRTVRVEVTDTRTERHPRCPVLPAGVTDAEETGRGLLLVSHLATRWDWHPRPDGPGKTVWAECLVPSRIQW
ncbi:ATP-binding protein [Streptomyces sp. NPDC013978]|uniref:ATP-binding protein n=1 Tax=Streptomyces sp. NPDC013978 TaxID=3364869 RepID=UPI0036FA42F0